jgi:aspartate oxidase
MANETTCTQQENVLYKKILTSNTKQQHQHQQHQQQKLPEILKSDRLIVVGSGVAGCATALVAAETYKVPVTLLFAGNVPEDCNSFWAQGGIIYRNYDAASGDSAALLAQDIHRAGAGLCVDDAVQKLSEEGPDRVRQLLLDDRLKKVFAQVPFDTRNDGSLSLCLGMFLKRRPF